MSSTILDFVEKKDSIYKSDDDTMSDNDEEHEEEQANTWFLVTPPKKVKQVGLIDVLESAPLLPGQEDSDGESHSSASFHLKGNNVGDVKTPDTAVDIYLSNKKTNTPTNEESSTGTFRTPSLDDDLKKKRQSKDNLTTKSGVKDSEHDTKPSKKIKIAVSKPPPHLTSTSQEGGPTGSTKEFMLAEILDILSKHESISSKLLSKKSLAENLGCSPKDVLFGQALAAGKASGKLFEHNNGWSTNTKK